MLLKNKKAPPVTPTEQLEELYRENYEGLYHTALLYLSNYAAPNSPTHQLAEEAIQETLVIAWQKWEEVLSSQSPQGWLYKTLRNKLHNITRSEWNSFKYYIQASNDANLAASENSQHIDEIRSLITPEEYRLLKRLYLDQASYDTVAAEEGCKKSTLAMRVKRLKQKIRKQYEKN